MPSLVGLEISEVIKFFVNSFFYFQEPEQISGKSLTVLETENFSLTGKVETGLGHLEVLENQDHHRQPEQQHQHTVSKPIIRLNIR